MKVICNQWSAVRRFIVLALICFTLTSVGAAQTGKAAAGGVPGTADQASQVTELDINGLKVLIKRRQSAPTVAAGLFIRGGARNVTEKTAGIENLTLNAATEASKNFPREVVRRELSRMGSSIGSAVSNDYSVVSLATTRANFDRSWEIFTDVILNPAFTPEDTQRSREQILTGLREAQTSPDAFLQVLQDRVIYANHPYANEPVGTIENISRFTPQDLRAYHQNLMQTSRLLLVMVGDLDANQLKARITESLGRLPRGSYKEAPLPPLDFSTPTLDVTTRSLPTNYIQGVFNAPTLNSPDYYAMRVAIMILRSRLFQEVRVKRQLSYAPNADLNNFAANTANIYVTAVDANQAVGVMLNEIEKLKTSPVAEDEIEGVAGLFLTTYYLGQETNAAQAAELARYELVGGGWRNSLQFLDKIREVKAADIRNVSEKYMKNIRFVVIGSPAAINRQVFLQN